MARRTKKKDPVEHDFGPGEIPRATSGPIPGLACAGDGCLFKPAADLVGKFSLRLARGHGHGCR